MIQSALKWNKKMWHLWGLWSFTMMVMMLDDNDDRSHKNTKRQGYINESKSLSWTFGVVGLHYIDVIMSAMASQHTSITIVYSTVYSGADQRKHQSSTSLAFVRGIHRWPVNSPQKGPVTQKMFPCDDVIMRSEKKKHEVSIHTSVDSLILLTTSSVSFPPPIDIIGDCSCPSFSAEPWYTLSWAHHLNITLNTC